MEQTCQRCAEPVSESDRYCRSCGMPQLVYSSAGQESSHAARAERQLDAQSEENDEDERSSEEFAAGVEARPELASATGIAWRLALNAAILLGVPAGFLCSSISTVGESLGLLWMLAAAAWAVVIYARRARPGWITMGMGARIGLVTGIVASWLTLLLNGVALWLERFAMHQGGQIDADWTTLVARLMDQVNEMNRQMAAQPGFSTTQAAQLTQFWSALFSSPEGRAGIMLSAFLFAACILLLFAVLGGMLGTRLLPAARRRPRV